MKMRFHLSFYVLYLFFVQNESLQFFEEKSLHNSKELTNDEIGHVAQLTDDKYFRDVLDEILIPRVVGTKNHAKVQKFIINELKKLNWEIELDQFKDTTPNLGALTFTNIIAHKNSNATRRLVLACHYDSKYFPNIEFVGATDSAVPCAMLIHLAKVLDPYISDTKVSLTLIFFDGEEAFEEWTPTDSIYGARSLASKWESMPFPRNSVSTNHLHRIDMLVLLDLIGIKNQKFASFFRNTDHWHGLLSKIEKKLKALNISPTDSYNILERSTIRAVEDDHLPFLQRNVPILHLIPLNFPVVWHTAGDNYSALDFPTIENMNKILQVFVYAYLHGASR